MFGKGVNKVMPKKGNGRERQRNDTYILRSTRARARG